MGGRTLIFRINEGGTGPELLREVLLKRGWTEYSKSEHAPYEWNLWWRTSRFRDSDYEQIFPWQRLNHYPRSTSITRKDCLARLLKLMAGAYGSAYNFAPPSFVLPNDYRRFVSEYSAGAAADKAQFWIYKPADLSRGRGILLFRELSELHYDTHGVVQRYVTNPLLVSGYKFDLRLYVVVRSYSPLVLYVYDDGLARFGTEKYNLSALGNVYSHLTNSSINKNSPSYADDKAGIGPGCKWSIRQLRQYLLHRRIDDGALWWRIVGLLVLTVAPLATESLNAGVDTRFGGAGRGACFELFGFDVLIDEALRPWLLEVNFSPALTADCSLDVEMKSAMLGDLVDMMVYEDEDALRGGEIFRTRQRNITSAIARSHILRPAASGKPLPETLRAGLRPVTYGPLGSGPGLDSQRRDTFSSATAPDDDSQPSGGDDDYGEDVSPFATSPTTTGGRRSRKRRTRRRAPAAESASVEACRLPPRTASADSSLRRCTARKLNSQEPQQKKLLHRARTAPPGMSGVHSSDSGSRLAVDGGSGPGWESPKRVGGFCRIYPFNEVTSKSQLSLRNIVSETTKLFRQQTESASSSKRAPQRPKTRYDIDNPFPELRRPRETSSFWCLD